MGVDLDSDFDGIERVANESAESASDGGSQDIDERREQAIQPRRRRRGILAHLINKNMKLGDIPAID